MVSRYQDEEVVMSGDSNQADGHEGPANDGGHGKDKFSIKIDRAEYEVHEKVLTGSALRKLPNPGIGPERDLFEVVPGGSDKKVENETEVIMRNGLRFFTAPAQINPGA
jgi:hypothetical protein